MFNYYILGKYALIEQIFHKDLGTRQYYTRTIQQNLVEVIISLYHRVSLVSNPFYYNYLH